MKGGRSNQGKKRNQRESGGRWARPPKGVEDRSNKRGKKASLKGKEKRSGVVEICWRGREKGKARWNNEKVRGLIIGEKKNTAKKTPDGKEMGNRQGKRKKIQGKRGLPVKKSSSSGVE